MTRKAVSIGVICTMRAVLSSTRGTRSRPFSVLTITAITLSMKPIMILRRIAQPEQDDEQRIEGQHRDRVIGGEERVERLAHGLDAVDDDGRR